MSMKTHPRALPATRLVSPARPELARTLLAGVLAFCGIIAMNNTPAEADSRADALELLPDDTAFVLSVDVKSMSKSTVAKELFAFVTKSGDIAQTQKRLLEEAKLDLTKDVDSLVIGLAGDIQKAEHIVFLARGRFDKSKVTSFLKKDATSFTQKQHRGINYYALSDDTEFAFMGSYFVATPKGGMMKVIDLHRGKAKSAGKNSRLAALVGKGYTKSNVWLAVVLTDAMRQEIASETGGHSMDAVVAGIDIATDVNITTLLLASDAKGAEALATMFTSAAKEMAREPSLQMFGLSDTFNKMKVAWKDTEVTVEMTIPGASLLQLLPVLQNAAP
jgi:hypothetical protein